VTNVCNWDRRQKNQEFRTRVKIKTIEKPIQNGEEFNVKDPAKAKALNGIYLTSISNGIYTEDLRNPNSDVWTTNNNLKCGKSTHKYKDGMTYEGDWKDDQRDGEGKLLDTWGIFTKELSKEIRETGKESIQHLKRSTSMKETGLTIRKPDMESKLVVMGQFILGTS